MKINFQDRLLSIMNFHYFISKIKLNKGMKSYLKSIKKSIYEKVERVVEDEYIEPITQNEVYSIINRKRKSSYHLDKNHKFILNGQTDNKDDIVQNMERMGLITPERQFMMIGQNFSLQAINYRLKELKAKSEGVRQHMVSCYGNNLQCIETALVQIQNIKDLNRSQQKSQRLREKMQRLESLVNKTMRITRLNIKLRNIKDVLRISQRIPNIKKMSLFQLKNISLGEVEQFRGSMMRFSAPSRQGSLECIRHLDSYIDKVSSQHLRLVISSITECLADGFQTAKYQKAIKGFIVSKSTIDYQKLLLRLVQTQIRDKVQQQVDKADGKSAFFLRCQAYIKILINIFKIIRWHRYSFAARDTTNEIQQKIRARNNSIVSSYSQKSQQNYPAVNLDSEDSIKINTEQIKNHACSLMDLCLKQQIQEILFNDSIQNWQVFQLLTVINRFYQIAFSFSSYIFWQSKDQIEQILMRKCYKLHQKGLKQFSGAVALQQGNQWNRLPVLRNFRYKAIQKSIQKVKKLSLNRNIPSLTCQNLKFLNFNYRLENEDSFQLYVAQQRQDTFEYVQFRFPHQKLDRMHSFEINDSPLPEHEDPQVVLCQSSITILAYLDHFLNMYFYFPIQEIRNHLLDKMSFYIQYYIFYIFQTFLSEMYKKYFFEQYQSVQQKYLQVRTMKIYQNLGKFIRQFKQKKQSHQSNTEKGSQDKQIISIEMAKYGIRGYALIKKEIKQSRVGQQSMVKVRAIASDSLKFVVSYFKHILLSLERYTIPNGDGLGSKKQQNWVYKYLYKIESYKTLQSQISDLLLTDSVPVTTKIDFVVPIMKKIKWHEFQNSKQIAEYGNLILKNIKQVYDKMKSMSKGQIPFYVVDRIFSFYWKTQLTFMTKTFLDQHIAHKQKGGITSKLAFEKLVDVLFQGLVQFLNQKYQNNQTKSYRQIPQEYASTRTQLFKVVYLKIKSIFPVLFQKDWPKCREMIESTFKNFQFIYKIQICIMKASQSCSGLSSSQVQERQTNIDEFIKQEILK